MNDQITDSVFMVRPFHFCMNEQTAVTNHFQQQDDSFQNDSSRLLQHVHAEFDRYVASLRDIGVNVIVVEDRPDVVTPDSIFPNNWIVSDVDGNISLFPMCAPNRRLERRSDVLDKFRDAGFKVNNIIDLSQSEEEGCYLEGTGSMILDRQNCIAYCALSPRSDEALFRQFCEKFQYRPVVFKAYQTISGSATRAAIYHTNVMLTVAEAFAVICLDCIDDQVERTSVIDALSSSGKELVIISEDQVASFAGNMLQLRGGQGERFLVMSQTAYNSLKESQIKQITSHCKIITVDIAMIEKLGGGSARCMLGEVFLPRI
jgi:hypothetical protein